MMALSAGQRFAIRWARNIIRDQRHNQHRYYAEKYRHPERNNIMGYDEKLFLKKDNKPPKPPPKKGPTLDDFTMLLVITSIGSLIYAH